MKLIGNCGGLPNCSCTSDDTSLDFGFAGCEIEDEGGGEGESSSSGGGGGGALVVVGVKLDSRSKELLTWALVKVAQGGDRVIALHVIDPNNESGTASLSAVKNFEDSLLSGYDGFCKLKQIDLKFKVCRGTPVDKVLAREATSSGAMFLVVGISVNQSAMKSPISVARNCARNIRRDITVFSVDNGKVMFKREANVGASGLQGYDGTESRHKKRTLSKSPLCLSSSSLHTSEDFSSQLSSSSGPVVNKKMALVPVKNEEMLEKRTRWAFLRKVLLHKGMFSSQSLCNKSSARQWLMRLPSRRQSLSTICPDQEQCVSDKVGHHSYNLDMDTTTVESTGARIASTLHLPHSRVRKLPKELEDLFKKHATKGKLFDYQELLTATSNFKADNMIGKGGSSEVYRGILQDGKELAVKILKPSGDASKQFVSEIEMLTSLDHKNIISLLGFCFEKNCPLLVYNLLSRGSLEDNLHGNQRSGNWLGWKERYKVALGVAEALAHLHTAVAEPVIHRDVKSSNILLSDDFNPKLSDFGLAMLASSSTYHIDNPHVAGTFGYLAPEYVMHGKVNDKIDVYAYGVVLLELLSGRKPIDRGHKNGLENLVIWAKTILEGGKSNDLLDPTLVDSHDHDLLEQMVLSASLCIRRTPILRPEMSQVVKLLQGDPKSVEWAREQVKVLDKLDVIEGEGYATNIQSFINLALLNVEDDAVSSSSGEQTVSVEEYLRERCSRSSSFNR